jgi:hypothetical protein
MKTFKNIVKTNTYIIRHTTENPRVDGSIPPLGTT